MKCLDFKVIIHLPEKRGPTVQREQCFCRRPSDGVTFFIPCVYKQGHFCLLPYVALCCCSNYFQSYSPTRLKQVQQQIWRQTVKVLALSHSFFWLFLVVQRIFLGCCKAQNSIAVASYLPMRVEQLQDGKSCFSQTFLQLFFSVSGWTEKEREKSFRLISSASFGRDKLLGYCFCPFSSSLLFDLQLCIV